MIINRAAFALSISTMMMVPMSSANPVPTGGYDCSLPLDSYVFSLICKGDATIQASAYTNVAVGGEFNKAGSTSSFVNGMAYMETLSATSVNWNGGFETGSSLSDVIDFEHFEWLAVNAKDLDENGYKVIVKTSGGTFDTEDFRPGGQAYDNGKTLVIFNTHDEVTLTKSNSGRQFGPSVLAPFSKVNLKGQAGFVNGFVVAKEFDSNLGKNPSQLQLHGAGYAGPLTCDQAGLPISKWRSIDGSGEDARGESGAILLRLTEHAYPDGVGNDMVEGEIPRFISNAVAANDGADIPASSTSDMLWAWGQFIDHDVGITEPEHEGEVLTLMSDCENDDLCTILFTRSEHTMMAGVRQHPNRITSFLDASMVYGHEHERAAALREFSGGRLKVSGNDLLPFNIDGLANAAPSGANQAEFFLAGDIRANEQLGLASMHTLFVREHNRLVAELDAQYPDQSDEELYQMARKIVGAEIQVITYNEFLPHLLGPGYAPNPETAAYDATVNPALSTEFSTFAFRVGHTMLSSDFQVNEQGDSLLLEDLFFDPQRLVDNPSLMENILEGFTMRNAQMVDTKVIDDCRTNLFGAPVAKVGLDLVSLNIQRGRDHGIGKYNDVREGLNMPRALTFADITDDVTVQQDLSTAYSSVNEIDAWIGGLAENHVDGGIVGNLFATVIGDQFTRLMNGDPFFYKFDDDLNDEDLKTNVIDVENIKLADILTFNTAISIPSGSNVMEITSTPLP